jgi:uncharacterized membrane protein YgcG
MRILERALLALVLLAAPAAAQADERILHFWSDVAVQKDASVDVTETIDVRAENVAINHGIYRDFPTRYKNRIGGRTRIGFTFEGATLDGAPVPASTSAVSNGVRIKLGDPDKTVEVGEHRYLIRYRATREIGFFDKFDEIYWNATGNGWVFPIDDAQVRIHLPSPVKLGERASYTGPQGATGSNAEITDEKPGEIAWRTTQPLGSYEGLTVAVAFPKGVVTPPGPSSRFAAFLADNGPPAVGVLSLLGLIAFFYQAYRRVGRDPKPGTVVPLFSPPDDLTPAGMRYISKMGADNRTFAAALVDMGVRGHIRMVEEDGGWFSKDKTRIDRLESANPLPHEEEEALSRLAMPGESIMMIQKNYQEFGSAKKALEAALKIQYEGKLFKRNAGWAAAGLLLFIAALWVTAMAIALGADAIAPWQIAIVVGSIAVAVLLSFVIHNSSQVGKCLLSLLVIGAVGVASAFGFPAFRDAVEGGAGLPMVIPFLALPLVITCAWWISAPTKEGRAVLDRIAGFKQYLSITERERLDRMTAPEDTPEVFERYLPYAIALGVENRWADRFQGVLAAAAAAPGAQQQGFLWYSGHGNPWDDPTGFVNNVGSTLSSTISSASTAPGSSSGSGGGGSSGGGGGGGGGGGR